MGPMTLVLRGNNRTRVMSRSGHVPSGRIFGFLVWAAKVRGSCIRHRILWVGLCVENRLNTPDKAQPIQRAC